MDNEINEMIRKEKVRERLILFSCILIYFLCFVLSEAFENCVFPEWMLETYKKLPK